MFYDTLATTIETASRNQLDDLSRLVSRAFGAGTVSDDEAQRLYELVQIKRGPRLIVTNLVTATAIPIPRYWIQTLRRTSRPASWRC
jgi:hypothetical protein